MSYQPNAALEAALIRRFVVPAKQARYLGFVARPGLRGKFIRDLHHLNFLRYDLFEPVGGNEQAFVQQRLRDALPRLTTCYVVSEISALDQQTLPIEEALDRVIGADAGSLLVFGNADLVYAEAEGINLRWLSRLPPPPLARGLAADAAFGGGTSFG
jgi:hypothetical protein